ncbi:hypothetical protein ACQY1Q_10360 [Tenacibaculum sp. TC6]|uniref:hypothetical protein n=1 Tax=Tenacibaculum sp. TC6 TaxID=3423223 RepID=UPI003D36F286
MHKKLASDLTSLAHSILQMKNKEDVLELKKKAYEVYEKLSVLAYVEEYINTTPHATVTKEELIEKITKAEEQKEEVLVINEVEEEVIKVSEPTFNTEEITEISEETAPEIETSLEDQIISTDEPEENKDEEIIISSNEEIESESTIITEPEIVPIEEEKEVLQATNEVETPIVPEEITEQPFDELEGLLFGDSPENTKNDVKDVGERKTPTLEEELEDTLPVDVMANLFEKAEPKKSLNDHFQSTIQIGLNDRIAFVKHLFEGNQSDFNRVISQLNTCKTEIEAKKFINKLVKPDYNWTDKEEYEARLMEIIERRFA